MFGLGTMLMVVLIWSKKAYLHVVMKWSFKKKMLLWNDDGGDIVKNYEIVCNKIVSLKLSLFARRFLNNKFSTKETLLKRDILNIDSQLCVNGCEVAESIGHLFFKCPLFR